MSREHEMAYHDYYGWPYYWVGGDVWGVGPYPGALAIENRVPVDPEDYRGNDPHLRSAHEVTGFYIEATDGDIGHVEDFIIDDESWEIRYMVVDTQNWCRRNGSSGSAGAIRECMLTFHARPLKADRSSIPSG
jgi:hypothetical protein